MLDSPVAAKRKLISVVIPAYDEQVNLPAAYDVTALGLGWITRPKARWP